VLEHHWYHPCFYWGRWVREAMEMYVYIVFCLHQLTFVNELLYLSISHEVYFLLLGLHNDLKNFVFCLNLSILKHIDN